MKYSWNCRKYWWGWIKKDIARFIYDKIYGFKMSWKVWDQSTMLPDTGKGKFVSVYVKGKITQMIDEKTKEEILLIPFQPNHGVMVEYWKDGKMVCRGHFAIEDFIQNQVGKQEQIKL